MKIPQWLRTKGINWSCSAMNWLSDRVIHPAPTESLRFRFGCWLSNRAESAFAFFYSGSKQEIEDGIDFAHDSVALEYLTPVQREIRLRFAEWV